MVSLAMSPTRRGAHGLMGLCPSGVRRHRPWGYLFPSGTSNRPSCHMGQTASVAKLNHLPDIPRPPFMNLCHEIIYLMCPAPHSLWLACTLVITAHDTPGQSLSE